MPLGGVALGPQPGAESDRQEAGTLRQDVRLGQVSGIPVGANWTVAVILVIIAWLLGASVLPSAAPHQPAVLYWTVAVAGAVLFLASLLAHELRTRW